MLEHVRTNPRPSEAAFAYGQAQHSDTQKPDSPIRSADIVVANPSVGADLIRPCMKEGARLYAYVSAISVPAKTDSAFWLGLQEAMHWPDDTWYRINAQGERHLFGDIDNWPLAQLFPKNSIADALVEFCASSEAIRAHGGIYLDEATKYIPDWVFKQMGLDEDSLSAQEQQTAYAHYINRVISGLRTKMGPDFPIIANSDTFTHPALNAITYEEESTERPNARPQEEGAEACKNQAAKGLGGEECVAWYGAGSPEAIKGVWGN